MPGGPGETSLSHVLHGTIASPLLSQHQGPPRPISVRSHVRSRPPLPGRDILLTTSQACRNRHIDKLVHGAAPRPTPVRNHLTKAAVTATSPPTSHACAEPTGSLLKLDMSHACAEYLLPADDRGGNASPSLLLRKKNPATAPLPRGTVTMWTHGKNTASFSGVPHNSTRALISPSTCRE